MNIIYNVKGLGDVAIVQIDPTYEGKVTVTKKGDVVLLHGESKLVGLNIFNASEYVTLEEGVNEATEADGEAIDRAMERAGFDERLQIDLSPKFVVGYVEEKEKHPDADKLNVCRVNVGGETLQIVCGAGNVDAGQKVVVAKVGAVMPSGLVIKDAKLRGVPSSGMICSAKELAIESEQKEGILVLEEDRTVGEAFFE